MNCPHCKTVKTLVTDSRPHGRHIKRRRVCETCGSRFWTIEAACLDPIVEGPNASMFTFVGIDDMVLRIENPLLLNTTDKIVLRRCIRVLDRLAPDNLDIARRS